jgi:hypothetical protein
MNLSRTDPITKQRCVTPSSSSSAGSAPSCLICRIHSSTPHVVTHVVPALSPESPPFSSLEWVAPSRHVTDLAALTEEELDAFIRAWRNVELRRRRCARSLDSYVTTQATHVAGYVVGSALAPAHRPPTLVEVASDVARAKHEGLLLRAGGQAASYVPYAPAHSGEIRIAANQTASARLLLAELLEAFYVAGRPYKLTASFSPGVLFRLWPDEPVQSDGPDRVVRDPGEVAFQLRLTLGYLRPRELVA